MWWLWEEGGDLGERVMLQWLHGYYVTRKNIQSDMKRDPVALTKTCLFIIWFTSPVAPQHNCSLYAFPQVFSHTHTHNHTYMFTNDMQHIAAAVHQATALKSLFYITKS